MIILPPSVLKDLTQKTTIYRAPLGLRIFLCNEGLWKIDFETATETLPSIDLDTLETFPLLVTGTPFQTEVWKCLLQIPRGEVRSYEWVAQRVGSPKAFRAAGSAIGKNPIPYLIPCHRVISKGGKLGGFSGGLPHKIRLLAFEGINVDNDQEVRSSSHRIPER